MPTAAQIFSKARKDEMSMLISAVNEAFAEIEGSFPLLTDQVEAINGQIQTYNGHLADLASFRDDTVSLIEEAIEEKSEKWREGEVGQSWTAWKEAWENFEFNELDEIDAPDQPEGLETDEIEALPQEPEA
jgi:hypothetical protein